MEISELQLLRCDSCCAKGVVRVELMSGNDLMFCGHHYDKNAAALVEFAALVEDDRVVEKEVVTAGV